VLDSDAKRPDRPPPNLQEDLSTAELTAIGEVVGDLPKSLALPLQNARGREFQRLEFLGDSVLDLVLNTHAMIDPLCTRCVSTHGNVSQLVTDAQLAIRATDKGVGAWLDWEPSPERLADLVEACVAAAWLAGGWAQVTSLVSQTVHDLAPGTTAVLLGVDIQSPPSGMTPEPEHRAKSRAGAALLELSAGWVSFRAHPQADEGELSSQRAVLHQVKRVAGFARRSHWDAAGPDSVVSNQVEAWLAETLLAEGADIALVRAADVLA
jgi:dsRNA-specific ribonuclease